MWASETASDQQATFNYNTGEKAKRQSIPELQDERHQKLRKQNAAISLFKCPPAQAD